MDLASGSPAPAASPGAEPLPAPTLAATADARAAERSRTASTLLREHAALLLPLASSFRDSQPVFESAIRGSSMSPALPSRARLRVQVAADPPWQPGDVVYYLGDEGYVVHRVVYRMDPDLLLTCGDKRLAPDPPVQASRVLGTVIGVETASGWRAPGPPDIGPWYRRAIRAATLAATIVACRVSPPSARWLALRLRNGEALGRAAAGRLRARLRRGARTR
jgi:hypothetical protein